MEMDELRVRLKGISPAFKLEEKGDFIVLYYGENLVVVRSSIRKLTPDNIFRDAKKYMKKYIITKGGE